MEEARSSETKQTILIVDDAAFNRALLADMLGDAYRTIEACNGLEAIAAIERHGAGISLILLDIVMPEMDGLEVLTAMNERGWIGDIPVIMVSSETSSSVIEQAYSMGATDFISRPFDTSIVRRRVTNTLMLYAKQKALADMVEDQIRQRERSVRIMISILSQIVEFRNGESGSHVMHVNTMTELLLDRLAGYPGHKDLTSERISIISMAASLHDVGKISIPEEILNKPGKLTPEEFELMKQHSVIGADMLEGLPNFDSDPLISTAHDICRWHHERYDGSGYPDGLVGDEIPLSAQVVALADVYDALTSKRVYKDAISHERSIEMIMGGECGAFSPELLRCLSDIADDLPRKLHLADEQDRSLGAAPASREARSSAGPSDRTLELLDYERMKFDFYAMMSNEVQYEFTVDPPIMKVSDWGTAKIGLPEVILDPYSNEQIEGMFGKESLQSIGAALRATTPDDPIYQADITAVVDGEPRWFHLAARAMWGEGESGPVYRGSIGKLIDVHESRQRMSDLERKATHDSLTGLLNHDFAKKLISERMQENPEDIFILMIIDLDHFKEANDTYGHMFGDDVLRHLASRLRDSVRDSDAVVRVGGDEFLICMQVERGVDIESLVNRIFRQITGDFKGFPIEVSMGVVSVEGARATYSEMFRGADNALYAMKRSGRGGCVFGELDRDIDSSQHAGSSLSQIDIQGDAAELGGHNGA